MSFKRHFLISVAGKPALLMFASVLAASATAANVPTTPVVVETNEAIFYQTSSKTGADDTVRFLPKTEICVLPFDGPQDPLATSTYWRAGVFFKAVKHRDLSAIRGEWTGKSLVPASLTAVSECQLATPETVRSVVLEVSAKDRDLSAADSAAICQFRFRIPNTKVDAVVAALQKQAADGSLIKRALPFTIQITQSPIVLSWSAVQASLGKLLQGHEDDTLAADEAVFLLGIAVGSDKVLADSVSKSALVDRRAFIDSALATLFATVDGGQLKPLKDKASGEFAVTPTSMEKTYEL